MVMFWRNKEKKRTYAKRPPKTLKQILSDAFSKELSKNPELMQQASIKHGAKELGIEFEKSDPIEQQKREIKAKIIERALKKIDENPELAEQFVNTTIEEIIGGGRGEGQGYGDGEGAGSILRQAIEELDDVEEFRERISGKAKGSALGGLVDSETLKEVLRTIQSLRAPGGVPQERIFVVQVNEELREVTETEYKRLIQQGLLRPIAALEAPKEKLLSEEPTELELPEFISSNLIELASYLEQEPEDFIIQLEYEVQSNVPQSQLLWDFLSTVNYEDIVGLATPYKGHSQIGIYVEKILSEEGKVWFEKVIELIKTKGGENELAR